MPTNRSKKFPRVRFDHPVPVEEEATTTRQYVITPAAMCAIAAILGTVFATIFGG